jgi:hypothetical protein
MENVHPNRVDIDVYGGNVCGGKCKDWLLDR